MTRTTELLAPGSRAKATVEAPADLVSVVVICSPELAAVALVVRARSAPQARAEMEDPASRIRFRALWSSMRVGVVGDKKMLLGTRISREVAAALAVEVTADATSPEKMVRTGLAVEVVEVGRLRFRPRRFFRAARAVVAS